MPDALNPTPEEVAMAEKYVEKFVGTVLVICGEQQPETVRLAMAHAVRNTALAAVIETTERAAKWHEKRMEERFAEHGTREPDTNATYYSGRYGETLETLDEEDEAAAIALRRGDHLK